MNALWLAVSLKCIPPKWPLRMLIASWIVRIALLIAVFEFWSHIRF
jgi:hypothetical protein